MLYLPFPLLCPALHDREKERSFYFLVQDTVDKLIASTHPSIVIFIGMSMNAVCEPPQQTANTVGVTLVQ